MRNQGGILVVALLFMILFMGISLVLVSLSFDSERDVRATLSLRKALYLAESGANASVAELATKIDVAKDGLGTVKKSVEGGSYSSVATLLNTGEYSLVSTGTYNGYTYRLGASVGISFGGIDPQGAFGVTGILPPLDKGYLKEKLKNNNLRIDGGTTPAIAVEDVDLFNELLSDMATAINKKTILPTIFSGSPLVPVSTSGGTVMLPFQATPTPPISSELLDTLRVQLAAKIINDFVPSATRTIKDAKGIAKTAVWGTEAAPEVTVISKDVTPANGTSITGNGTLVVLGNVKLGDNTVLNWKGNVFLISGYTDPKKEVKLSIDGGSLNVTGTVGLVDTAKAKVYMDVKKVDGTKDPTTIVNGSLLILNNPMDSKEEALKIDHASLTVNGLLAMSGERTKLMVNKDASNLIVNGSLQMGVIDGVAKTPEIKFNVTGTAYLTFNRQLVIDALKLLADMVECIKVDVAGDIETHYLKGWHPIP